MATSTMQQKLNEKIDLLFKVSQPLVGYLKLWIIKIIAFFRISVIFLK